MTKNVLSICFVLLCLMLLWGVVERKAATGKKTEISYVDLYQKVEQGQVLDATIQGQELSGHLKASPKDQFRTTLPANFEGMEKAMLQENVNFEIREAGNSTLITLLSNLGQFAIFLVAVLAVVPPFWIIFKKAGIPAPLSVLMLVPLVNLVLLYVVAFSKWKATI